jgi:hypothetical protein
MATILEMKQADDDRAAKAEKEYAEISKAINDNHDIWLRNRVENQTTHPRYLSCFEIGFFLNSNLMHRKSLCRRCIG